MRWENVKWCGENIWGKNLKMRWSIKDRLKPQMKKWKSTNEGNEEPQMKELINTNEEIEKP